MKHISLLKIRISRFELLANSLAYRRSGDGCPCFCFPVVLHEPLEDDYADCVSDSDSDSDGDGKCEIDSDADRDADGDCDSDSDSDADSDDDGHGDGDGDSPLGDGCTWRHRVIPCEGREDCVCRTLGSPCTCDAKLYGVDHACHECPFILGRCCQRDRRRFLQDSQYSAGKMLKQ